jgi:hypothetical protein
MKKSTAVVGVLILVVLLVAGTTAVLKWPGAKDGRSQISTDAIPDSLRVETAPSNQLEMSEPAPEANAPVNEAIPSEPRPDRPAERAPATTVTRVLVATDPSGGAVSADFVAEWRVGTDAPWVAQRVRTGADGRAELEAPLEAMLRLNVDEVGWVLGWRNVTIQGGHVEAPITVYAVLPLKVRVTYADGKPYVGLLTVKAKGLWQTSVQMVEEAGSKLPLPTSWPMQADKVSYSFHEIVEFSGLPSGVELTFGTRASRAGYSEVERTVTLTEITSAELIEVVIPEGVSPDTPGQIVLKPNEDQRLDGRCVLFRVLADGTMRKAGWNSRKTEVSGNIQAGRYVVVLLGAKAWQSEEFDLAPGEVKELTPALLEASSLSVRIVNEKGEPVAGAAISFATQELPWTARYGAEGVKPMAGEAVSDVDGKLSLAELPAGTFRFQIYGRNFQPWEGYATLIAGQDCDIGDIILEAAKGRIEVQFPEWDFAVRKLTWEVTDGEGNTIIRGTVDSSTLTVEGLPVSRTYKLRTNIKISQGSRAFWYTKAFELTPAMPTHKLDGTDKQWPSDLD